MEPFFQLQFFIGYFTLPKKLLFLMEEELFNS